VARTSKKSLGKRVTFQEKSLGKRADGRQRQPINY